MVRLFAHTDHFERPRSVAWCGPEEDNVSQQDRPKQTSGAGVTRREFVTTTAGLAAGMLIVPRHVLGRGFQAPSDTVNVAIVGINGMGASNAQNLMSQNIVAICDCDFTLLDNKLKQWKDSVYP